MSQLARGEGAGSRPRSVLRRGHWGGVDELVERLAEEGVALDGFEVAVVGEHDGVHVVEVGAGGVAAVLVVEALEIGEGGAV